MPHKQPRPPSDAGGGVSHHQKVALFHLHPLTVVYWRLTSSAPLCHLTRCRVTCCVSDELLCLNQHELYGTLTSEALICRSLALKTKDGDSGSAEYSRSDG